jgi:type II secretory pathway pseudopilin PulG
MNTEPKNEHGFTLVELLVGIGMTLILSMVAVSMFTTILHRQPESTKAADVIGVARNAVETITADLRKGESATLSNAYELKLMTPCSESSSGCEIKYKCAAESGKTTYSCTRTAAGKTTTVIFGLTSREVFCVYPTSETTKECGKQGTTAPRYVGATLEIPNHTGITGQTIIEDGAALHNLPEALAGQ